MEGSFTHQRQRGSGNLLYPSQRPRLDAEKQKPARGYAGAAKLDEADLNKRKQVRDGVYYKKGFVSIDQTLWARSPPRAESSSSDSEYERFRKREKKKQKKQEKKEKKKAKREKKKRKKEEAKKGTGPELENRALISYLNENKTALNDRFQERAAIFADGSPAQQSSSSTRPNRDASSSKVSTGGTLKRGRDTSELARGMGSEAGALEKNKEKQRTDAAGKDKTASKKQRTDAAGKDKTASKKQRTDAAGKDKTATLSQASMTAEERAYLAYIQQQDRREALRAEDDD